MDVGLPCRVHPVVQRPVEAVGVVLGIRVAPAVAVGDERAPIRFQVAVIIGHQPDVRWLGDEDAAIEDLDGSCEDQAVGENGALVHAPVGIGIFEHDHPANRLVLVRSGQIGHEAGHLDHPESAARIPVHGDRFLDRGLAGDELDQVAGRHEERLQRLLGRQRRRLGRHLLHVRRPGPVRLRALEGGGARQMEAVMTTRSTASRRFTRSDPFQRQPHPKAFTGGPGDRRSGVVARILLIS